MDRDIHCVFTSTNSHPASLLSARHLRFIIFPKRGEWALIGCSTNSSCRRPMFTGVNTNFLLLPSRRSGVNKWKLKLSPAAADFVVGSNNGIFNLMITITGRTQFLHDTITNRCSSWVKGKQQLGVFFPLRAPHHETLLKDRSLKSIWLKPGIASSSSNCVFCSNCVSQPHARHATQERVS